MNYTGLIAALCTSLSWSIGIFPFTEASRRMGANAVNHFRLLLAAIVLAIILVAAAHQSLTTLFLSPTPEQWLWLSLSGIVGLSIGDYFSFTAFIILGTRVGSMFTTLAPGAALLFGFLILGETINMTGILGMLTTIGGIIFISLNQKDNTATQTQHGSLSKGILFAILAACCQGIGLVFAKKGMSLSADFNPLHATWMRMLAGAATAYIFTVSIGRFYEINQPVRENRNGGLKYLMLGTLFGPVIGVSLSLYTVSMIEVSVAQTIFSLVPVLVLFIGWIFFKEKLNWKALLAVMICMIGVMLLIWRDFF